MTGLLNGLFKERGMGDGLFMTSVIDTLALLRAPVSLPVGSSAATWIATSLE